MKHQGDSAELKFMLLNHELGYIVSKPFGDNAKYDLIVDTKEHIERVQVKSTRRRDNSGGMDCYSCLVCSGSRSKNKYSSNDIDYVAIYVIPENAWYKIPVQEISGKSVKLYPHRRSKKNTYEKYRM
jgi:hypothetical protein